MAEWRDLPPSRERWFRMRANLTIEIVRFVGVRLAIAGY
jgi:hypothetical protein